MKAIYARDLKEEEKESLKKGLKAAEGHTVRRCQIILLSAEDRLKAKAIGQRVGLSDQCVREALHEFNEKGLESIYPKELGRKDDQRAFDDAAREQLLELVRRSPRDFGYENSLWTLELLAKASYQQGLTATQVHLDTISETLRQLGIAWKRAKPHIQSPDPQYEVKKNAATGSRS